MSDPEVEAALRAMYGREGMRSTAARRTFARATAPTAARQKSGRRGRPRPTVAVDATWRARIGFVAVVGALGCHARRVECETSTLAETLAVLFAMELAAAEAGSPRALAFQTDSIQLSRRTPATAELSHVHRLLARYQQWELKYVARSEVQRAHALAARARRGEFEAPAWSPML